MGQVNYKRRHDIQFDTMQTRELNLLLSFVWDESLDSEAWYEIKDMDSRYFISSEGRLLSLCNDRYKLMQPFICGDGYYYIDLRKNGKDKKFRLHRLVAEAFLSNPDNKPIVHHKDRNRHNNRVSNLQWMTQEEHNSIHRKINDGRKDNNEKLLH